MKIKRLILIMLMLPALGSSLDHSASIHCNLDNKNKREIELHNQITHHLIDNDILITPRCTFSMNGNVDLALGVGFRHLIDDKVFGFHGYLDINQSDEAIYHQFSLALEYYFTNWAIRSNHYFPVTAPYIKNNTKYTPVYWMENSITRKFRYLSTSLGSVYDFNSKTCHVKADVFVPIKGIVLGIHGNYPINGRPSAFISISFGYPMSASKGEPIIRNSKIRYSMVREEPKKPILPVIDPVLEEIEAVIDELADEITEELAPPEVTKPPETPVSWWDWFSSLFASDISKEPYGPQTEEYYTLNDYGWYEDDDSSYSAPIPSSIPNYNVPLPVAASFQSSPAASSNSDLLSSASSQSSIGPSVSQIGLAHTRGDSDSGSDVASEASSAGHVTPEMTPNSSFDLSLGSPAPAVSSPSINLGSPYSELRSPSNHYGPGDYYDPNRPESDSGDSDSSWIPLN